MMSEADLFASVTGRDDDLELAIAALRSTEQPFCLIRGLAVNHYAEPAVTLDPYFDIMGSGDVADALREAGCRVGMQLHSINAQFLGSRLRIQITVNGRYAAFPSRAIQTKIFGMKFPVAALKDLVQGKLWAVSYPNRRASKRAKDEADLVRICESHPHILSMVPQGLLTRVDQLRPIS